MSKKLIKRVGIFNDFKGDPTNPDDLFEYFHRTGKLYTALAAGGKRPKFSKEFIDGNEDQRILFFAMLSNAAAILLRHKGVQNLEEMTAYELSSALRKLVEKEIPVRYKRQQTGRKNLRTNPTLDKLLADAYGQFLSSHGKPPGRKKLAHAAEKICKDDPNLAHLKSEITEHTLRKFLQSQAKSGDI